MQVYCVPPPVPIARRRQSRRAMQVSRERRGGQGQLPGAGSAGSRAPLLQVHWAREGTRGHPCRAPAGPAGTCAAVMAHSAARAGLHCSVCLCYVCLRTAVCPASSLDAQRHQATSLPCSSRPCRCSVCCQGSDRRSWCLRAGHVLQAAALSRQRQSCSWNGCLTTLDRKQACAGLHESASAQQLVLSCSSRHTCPLGREKHHAMQLQGKGTCTATAAERALSQAGSSTGQARGQRMCTEHAHTVTLGRAHGFKHLPT